MIRKKGLTIVLAIIACILVVLTVLEYKAIDQAGIDKDNVTQIETPEQTVSTENPAFVKEEFVAEVPEGTNIAGDAKIEANGFVQAYTERKAIDGDAEGASYWEGIADSYPNTVTLTYDNPVKVHALRLRLNPDSIWGKRTQQIEIQISSDGENYETLVEKTAYDFDPDTGNQVIAEFDEVEIKGIQLVFYDNTGAHAGQAAEIELYAN